MNAATGSFYRRYDAPLELGFLVVFISGLTLFVGAWIQIALRDGPIAELGNLWEAGGTMAMLALAGAVLLLMERSNRRIDYERRRSLTAKEAMDELDRLEEEGTL